MLAEGARREARATDESSSPQLLEAFGRVHATGDAKATSDAALAALGAVNDLSLSPSLDRRLQNPPLLDCLAWSLGGTQPQALQEMAIELLGLLPDLRRDASLAVMRHPVTRILVRARHSLPGSGCLPPRGVPFPRLLAA